MRGTRSKVLAGMAAMALTVCVTAQARPVDPRAKAQLEQALACTAIAPHFERAEALLKQAGWRQDQGITPVTLAEPLKVYGFSIRKVAVSRDGFEHTYRSYVEGGSIPQLVKAASLKLGKDDKNYGRLTKTGVLTAEMEGGEATLTCTVDTEGGED